MTIQELKKLVDYKAATDITNISLEEAYTLARTEQLTVITIVKNRRGYMEGGLLISLENKKLYALLSPYPILYAII